MNQLRLAEKRYTDRSKKDIKEFRINAKNQKKTLKTK